MIQDRHETAAERAMRHAHQIVLLQSQAYLFLAGHGLQFDERRTGKTAKLIDLYARLNRVIL